ncbi:hypothetical protein CLOP_g13927 [Closterium sp. NIES-67]|nr:hypothetical protein CLOP_g13927 [Closterium sp. NIES-67]
MPEEGEARERWIEKSAVLFDLILQSVNKEMFEHIKDLVEADDSGPRAWKLLRDVVQPNTLLMVIVLEKELAAISMQPGDDVKPVLDKIKDTYARMAAAGSSVSQLQQCTKIISQTKGKDYDEVFAPVGKGTTLRVLLAIAALLGWKIRQMDIVTAFLNGIILEEEVRLEIVKTHQQAADIFTKRLAEADH